jgi:PAS domain S-box-containing protein
MKQLEMFEQEIDSILPAIPETRRKNLEKSFERLKSAIALQDRKYHQAIRDRAAVHSLLKKTSQDLIERYQTIFEYSGTAMVVIGKDGLISLVNSCFETMFGLPREKVQNHLSFHDFIEPDYRPQELDFHMRRFSGDTTVPRSYESKVICKGGRICDVSINIEIFPGTGQSIASITDITGQKCARNELEKHKDHLKAVLGVYQIGESPVSEIGSYTLSKALETTQSRYGIIVLPENIAGNEKQRWEWGLSDDSAAAYNLEEMVRSVIVNATPCTRDNVFYGNSNDQEGSAGHRLAIPVIESGTVVAVLCIGRSPDEYTRSDLLELTVLMNAMWRVISRQLQAKKIRLANDKLNLLNSVTRHDVKNALTSLHGYLELSREEIQSPELAIKFLDKGIRSAHHINDLIEFTRYYQDIGVREPAWYDVSHEFLRSASQLPVSGIEIRNETESLEIYTDPLIGKVFFNLIDNSIRHGTNITTISLRSRQEKEGTVLIYSDNGPGMPENEKERIFSRGYGKNTGLGLFLIREILSMTGISIKECGEYGKGAQFEILVPAQNCRFRIQPY